MTEDLGALLQYARLNTSDLLVLEIAGEAVVVRLRPAQATRIRAAAKCARIQAEQAQAQKAN